MMTNHEQVRRSALLPARVSLVERQHRRWTWIWSLLTALSTGGLLIVADNAIKAEHAREAAMVQPIRAERFDGYPLVGPGMTCWFKDIKPEGSLIVHDLCERFLDSYRRYAKR